MRILETRTLHLKACPFCGEQALPPYKPSNYWEIACGNCYASLECYNLDELVKMWNTRKRGRISFCEVNFGGDNCYD